MRAARMTMGEASSGSNRLSSPLAAPDADVVADAAIIEAVASQTPWMEELLVRLVEAPTVLGQEEPGQVVMAAAFRELGLEPVDVPMDAAALRAHPAAAPFSWSVEGKRNVVATWSGAAPAQGRSLILNGHVDVVSPEPVSLWTGPPFVARRDGDWIYGRGAGDMKCGLAAVVGAIRGLRQLGLQPCADVTLESVVEEECTGNGALQCLLAGHRAEAAVVAEPFGNEVTVAQVGVLWFEVTIIGVPVHVGDAGLGVNAIERSFVVIKALRELEAELNERRPPPFDAFDHPINLNVGVIHGGDWPSTVAGECTLRCRLALYPGELVADLRARIEAAVARAAAADSFLSAYPPTVSYDGFACQGFTIDPVHELVRGLSSAYQRVTGEAAQPTATTATTDARVFALQGGMPAACLGPYSEQMHAVDERVYRPSITQAAQALALFVRDWCGLR